MDAIGGVGAVEELALLRMLECLRRIDREPPGLRQVELDPTVIPADPALCLAFGDRKADFEPRRDAFGARE